MNQTVESSELIQLVRLINRFRLHPESADIYEQAIGNYNALLELIENPRTVVKLALMAEMPVSKIMKSAEAILDSLLFNKRNDPFISLGLRGDEDRSTVMKRWKNLITIFHPDKYPGNKLYEERAKRINEAYEEIRRSNKKIKGRYKSDSNKPHDNNIEVNTKVNKQPCLKDSDFRGIKSYQSLKFLRKLPLIIIFIMLIISFVAVFLLIKNF